MSKQRRRTADERILARQATRRAELMRRAELRDRFERANEQIREARAADPADNPYRKAFTRDA